jgi:hypothetical protein
LPGRNNSIDRPADDLLLSKAQQYASKFTIISVDSDKKPVLGTGEVEAKRVKVTTGQELTEYFGEGKNPRTVGIGLLIHRTEFSIDTDGKGEWVFQKKVMPNLPSKLRNKINSTMATKTPNGFHRTFKLADVEMSVKDETFWSLGEHNEIAVQGKDHYSIEYAPGYEEINGLECQLELDESEVYELTDILARFRKETNAINKIVRVLRQHHKPNTNRDKIAFAIAGYLHKKDVPERIILGIVETLATVTNDEQLESRLDVVRSTCAKDRNEVSGYSELLTVLEDNASAITTITSELRKMGYRTPDKSNGKKDGESGEEGTGESKSGVVLRLIHDNSKEFFTDQFGDAYGAVDVEGHIETLRIKSSRFTRLPTM